MEAIHDAAITLGDRNPVGHHVTNVILTEMDEQSVRVRSKGIGIQSDGSSGSVVYDDVVKREPGGWRIAYRKVTPRRAPLGA
jgi:3-phenylpropionate/cinnamic acid dioxygenase small subunit